MPNEVTAADADRAREIVTKTHQCPCVRCVALILAALSAVRSSQREADAALVEDGKWCDSSEACALGMSLCAAECATRRRLAAAIRAQP